MLFSNSFGVGRSGTFNIGITTIAFRQSRTSIIYNCQSALRFIIIHTKSCGFHDLATLPTFVVRGSTGPTRKEMYLVVGQLVIS